MRNLKVVFPEGSAFDNYKFTIDDEEGLEKDFDEEEELEKDFDEKDEELEENLEKDEKI